MVATLEEEQLSVPRPDRIVITVDIGESDDPSRSLLEVDALSAPEPDTHDSRGAFFARPSV
jgi:hypothetical protein